MHQRHVQQLIGQLNDAAGGNVYRLPTEAEWEYACRLGTSTPWCFGDDEGQLGSYAWYSVSASDAGLDHAQPVGTKLANAWDLFDMHGNVYEWVEDWMGTYSKAPVVDPQGPSSGTYRVLRGGGWGENAQATRSACRGPMLSTDHFPAEPLHFPVVGARLLRMEADIATSVSL